MPPKEPKPPSDLLLTTGDVLNKLGELEVKENPDQDDRAKARRRMFEVKYLVEDNDEIEYKLGYTRRVDMATCFEAVDWAVTEIEKDCIDEYEKRVKGGVNGGWYEDCTSYLWREYLKLPKNAREFAKRLTEWKAALLDMQEDLRIRERMAEILRPGIGGELF